LFGEFDMLQQFYQSGQFTKNGAQNIIDLPSNAADALANGLSMHYGGDATHIAYTDMVRGVVQEIQDNAFKSIDALGLPADGARREGWRRSRNTALRCPHPANYAFGSGTDGLKVSGFAAAQTGPLFMSPNVLAVVVALTGVSIFFGAFYLNIRRAKKRVSRWKPGSSYLFIRSNGLSGVKTRATRVWIKELGYEEPEVLIIARYQKRDRDDYCRDNRLGRDFPEFGRAATLLGRMGGCAYDMKMAGERSILGSARAGS
jgi:A nuclease family of the HNH/ENDO VII superfamily with conserved AHH